MLDADDLFLKALNALRARLRNRRLNLPRSVRWRVETNDDAVVVAQMPASDLGRNLQTDAAAAPLYALFLAWWFERLKVFGAQRVRARVEVLDGPVPETPDGQRSAFVLHELAQLFPDRFECAIASQIRWPAKPVVRATTADRYATSLVFGVEQQIETVFMGQQGLAEQFAPIGRIEGFRRLPPFGLYDDAEGTAMRKGPSGRSQTHLSAPSVDGRTVHVFALKDLGNSRFGIVPEAFWLARLLHRVRTGDPRGVPITGGGDEINILRRAERISMWLLVQDVHPFVRLGDDTPLLWLRAAMKEQGVSLGVLPYDYERTKKQVRLRVEQRWA